jgi:sigma-B regulation protein RsbU (phosphoserine phosphatase)
MLLPQRYRGHHAALRRGFVEDDPTSRPMGAKLELCGLRQDGAEFPVDISLSPLDRDPVTEVLAAIRDITDRKEAERERIQVETALAARFHRLMEHSNVAMALLKPNARLEVVNQALCDLVGFDELTLGCMTWYELAPEQGLEADQDYIARLLDGRLENYRTTTQRLHADGHLLWLDLSMSCLRDPVGEVEYLVAQCVDVTEAVNARDLLARREEENRLLAERLQMELDNAAEYVKSILPAGTKWPIETASRYLPALDLGGDVYDYRWIDDDHLMIYLVDVSGHGVRPALLAVALHNLLRSGSLPPAVLRNPDHVLDAINRLFPSENQAGSYSTIWYGVYQRLTRTLRYASAGHPPALFLTRESGGIATTGLSTPAQPIGMFDNSVYTCDSHQVPDGAQLLLYSDGAFELHVKNADGTRWSRSDFVELCAELAERPDWSLDELVHRLQELSPTGEFEDDCTLVVLTFPENLDQ